MTSKFGQLLLWGNLITPEQLEHALEHQRTHGGKLGEILHQLGYVSDDDVTRTLGMKYGIPTVNLKHLEIDKSTLGLMSAEMARSKRVIPLSRVGSVLTCAMEDPTRVDLVREVEFQTGCNVQPVLVTSVMMSDALERHYPTARNMALPFAHGQGAKAAAEIAISRAQSAKRASISEIHGILEQLSPEKLEYVRRFVASITTL
jgi:type IV pilus assembly protein PilB